MSENLPALRGGTRRLLPHVLAPVMYLHTLPSYARLCAPWPLPREAFYNSALSLYVHSLYRPLRKRRQRTLPQPLGP